MGAGWQTGTKRDSRSSFPRRPLIAPRLGPLAPHSTSHSTHLLPLYLLRRTTSLPPPPIFPTSPETDELGHGERGELEPCRHAQARQEGSHTPPHSQRASPLSPSTSSSLSPTPSLPSPAPSPLRPFSPSPSPAELGQRQRNRRCTASRSSPFCHPILPLLRRSDDCPLSCER